MKLYNTLGRSMRDLGPPERAIGIYSCGPTVQAEPHLGHGRQAVVFDVLRRYLEWRGHEVTYVMNITDVDDKIIARAAELDVPTEEVVATSLEAFEEGYRRLNVREPDIAPRATEHIGEMIAVIERLVELEHAYAADGDVYFAVRSFPEYGRLSGRDIDELQSGARVEPGEHKRDPLDFALWKAAVPGEPAWESPWGPGRPGWHIECSAMAEKYLGFGFDIHAGGSDLIFPHHENEIAQSEAAAQDAPFARIWAHNGLVNLSGEKMAKSTGNVISLVEAAERWDPVALRLFYLRKHYRAPLDFSEEAVADAAGQLERLRAFLRRAGEVSADPDPATMEAFVTALDDDLSTPEALAATFSAVNAGNISIDEGNDPGPYAAAVGEIMDVLGLSREHADVSDLASETSALAERYGVPDGPPGAVIDRLVALREQARADGDYATADAIRNALAVNGIAVEDSGDGSRWHRP